MVLTGCDALFGLLPVDVNDGGVSDGNGANCFGTGLLRVCLDQLPTQPVRISTNTPLDTGSSNMCAALTGANAGSLCVVAGTSILIDPAVTLTGTGTKPLVLIATTGTIEVAGTIDVASRAGGTTGAGADAVECFGGGAAATCAGGGGGGFGGGGGSGGGVNNGTCAPRQGGTPGMMTLPPTTLRGGCPGTSGSPTRTPGHGGGAVYLIAQTSISVIGAINASGGAGDGGAKINGGGAGGGSGGMIGLDAPMILIGGQVFANGGGGGGGASNTVNGSPGGESTTASMSGGGGNGVTFAGDGGTGSVGATLSGGAGKADYSGGGGGGGAGVIVHFGLVTGGGTISPPAQ